VAGEQARADELLGQRRAVPGAEDGYGSDRFLGLWRCPADRCHGAQCDGRHLLGMGPGEVAVDLGIVLTVVADQHPVHTGQLRGQPLQ
jgi:hypothetical protein